MPRFVNSIYITWRDRGLLALVCATLNHIVAIVLRDVLNRSYIQRKIHNYQMLLDLNDLGLSRSLLLFAKREMDHKLLLEKIVKPNMTIYDIGANIGYYPLMELDLIGRGGTLIAIEPVATNIALLEKNFSLNNQTLIPRPETEHVVEVVKALPTATTIKRIVDVGTGSGCIGVTLALELDDVEEILVDKQGINLGTVDQDVSN